MYCSGHEAIARDQGTLTTTTGWQSVKMALLESLLVATERAMALLRITVHVVVVLRSKRSKPLKHASILIACSQSMQHDNKSFSYMEMQPSVMH